MPAGRGKATRERVDPSKTGLLRQPVTEDRIADRKVSEE